MAAKDFYVYTHATRGGRVFYVGKGKDDRAWVMTRRGRMWSNIVTKHGAPIVRIVQDGLQEWAAVELEMALIALHGRRDLGYGALVNVTDGGEGPNGVLYSAERRRAIGDRSRGQKNGNFGRPMSAEQKAKLSLAKKGKPLTAEHRAKLSTVRSGAGAPWFGKKRSEDTKAKIAAAKRGVKHSDETKRKRTQTMERVRQTAEYKAALSAAVKASWVTRKLKGPSP